MAEAGFEPAKAFLYALTEPLSPTLLPPNRGFNNKFT